MRLVKRQEFLALPPGTLYAKLQEPWAFEGLALKSDTIMHGDKPGDFWSINLDWVESDDDTGMAFDRLDAMKSDPTLSYPMEWAATRGSDFDDNSVYLVYEHADTQALIAFLEHANHVHAVIDAETAQPELGSGDQQ